MVVLEITTPAAAAAVVVLPLWFDRLVPPLGRLAGDPDAYTYLPQLRAPLPGSARSWRAELAAAGLADVRWVLTAGGIIAIHAGARRA